MFADLFDGALAVVANAKSELPKGCTDAESGRLDHYCFGESENLRIDQGSASEEILNVVKCES